MATSALGKNWDFRASNLPSKKVRTPVSATRRAEYLRGLQDGMVAERRKKTDDFVKAVGLGLDRSHEHTETVFAYLKERGIKPLGARLRILSLEQYEVLVLLSEKNFLSPLMRSVYEHLHSRKKEWNTSTYKINFRFSSASGKAAEAHMACDGFDLSFVGNASARPGK